MMLETAVIGAGLGSSITLAVIYFVRAIRDRRERREMMEAYEQFEYCLKCGSEKTWVDCGNCDDGEVEEDSWEGWPSGEFADCETCEGKGGWYVCLNCHPEAGE